MPRCSEDTMPRSVPSVVSPPRRRKWLNLVLDLNGILCQCVDKYHLPRNFPVNDVRENIFSSTVPTVIGPKGVFTRPGLREFLAEVSDVVDRVVIWSSMKRSTVELIASFLFTDIRAPFDILGQDSCTRIQTSPYGIRRFLTGIGNSKDIFLKVLAERLFSNPTGSILFTEDNTLLVDDSPEKSVCNHNGNAIFLETWTRQQRHDEFLMGSLAPWLRNLHLNCAPGSLREFVDHNRIGCPPLPASDPLLRHIISGMRESSASLGFRYELPGIGLVIDPESCRPTRS